MQSKNRKCALPWQLIVGLLVGMAIGSWVPKGDLSLRVSREEPVFTVRELETVLEMKEVLEEVETLEIEEEKELEEEKESDELI